MAADTTFLPRRANSERSAKCIGGVVAQCEKDQLDLDEARMIPIKLRGKGGRVPIGGPNRQQWPLSE